MRHRTNIEPDPELEKFIAAELRQLPDLSAPPTLMPRVLALVETRTRPSWWQQPWLNWPGWAQAASVACAVAVLGLVTFGGRGLFAQVNFASLIQAQAEGFAWLGRFWNVGATLTDALALLVQTNQLWLFGGFAVLFTLYLTCVGVGTVGYRLIVAKRF